MKKIILAIFPVLLICAGTAWAFTWSPAQLIINSDPGNYTYACNADIAVDSGGNWHVVYGEYINPTSPTNGDYSIKYRNSMGDSSVIAHAVNSWLEEPAITMDSNGGLHVVYSNDAGVMYTNNLSGYWATPQLIINSDPGNYTYACNADIAVDSGGNWHVVYGEYINPTSPTNGDYSIKYRNSMGDSSVIAHAVNSWLEEPAITMDSNGGLHVVYSNDVGVMYTTTVGKEFMITFDDGPVPGNTENIVNALKNIYVGCEPVKAGFFMVGVGCCEDSNCFCPWYDRSPPKGSVRANNDLVQMVAREHHYIGIHTQHHPDFNAWFKDWSIESIKKEISDCYNEIRKALNSDNPNDVNIPKIFRPPYFSNNPNVQEAAKGFQMILGAGNNENAATADVGWRPFFWPITVDSIKNKAANLIREWDRDYPCVLTFHDISPVTPDNIAEIIRYLRKEGFTLVNFDPSRLPGRLPSLVHHAQNTIHQSEIVTHTVSLDSTVSTVTFNVSWEGSDLDLVLYKPDGTKIEPNSTLVDPNIKYAERDTYEYYTVSDPNPGNWIMEVSGVNVPPMGESYTIRVEADSNLALSAFTEKPDYELNENINMSAQLVNDENSVTGALVMAKVQRPDGSVDNLVLYDDGEHGDKDPNDGFYANAYDNTSLRGLYKLTTFAIGELTGDQYERASSLTVMVGSIIYGEVDFRAYAVLADHWLAQNCTEPNWCDTADLDQNGQVDIFDLGILVEYWLEDTNP